MQVIWLNNKSRVSGDVHARFCESLKGKFLWATRLKLLNDNLSMKVQYGIEEGKQKDKKILEQAKLARIGSMISMIAHQWRQPLSELSGILMELETATRFKKADENHILTAIEKSDKMI